MCRFAFLPFVIMFTCSIIILVRVGQHSKKLNKNKSEEKTINNSNQTQKFTNRTRNLALMLIPVNILFLIFLAPLVITMFTYEKLGEDSLTLALLEFWSYCNFTFNFLIYFVTSSKFREEFLKLMNENFSIKRKSCQKNKRETTIRNNIITKCDALISNAEIIPLEKNKNTKKNKNSY